MEVGALRTRIVTGRALTGAYSSIPLARIVECRADRAIVLDDGFMPAVLHVRASQRLTSMLSELLGLTHQRGEALGGRVTATGRGSTAEIAEYLVLQIINRHEPLLVHHASQGGLHPEAFYELCVSMAGELATFTTERKRPARFPNYMHGNLRESFDAVMHELRVLLSIESASKVVPIPLEPRKFGINVAIIHDRSLLGSAAFVLAARADVPGEELRRRFPAQLKIGPAEKIADIVRLGLSGVPVVPMPVAPRQLPYHAGFAYFEVDQTHELWAQMKTSGGVALFVAGDFPGLTMEMWAIRSDRST
jgi:type VI secretion system protein ImpJ